MAGRAQGESILHGEMFSLLLHSSLLVFLELGAGHLAIRPVILHGKRHKSRTGTSSASTGMHARYCKMERWGNGGVVYGWREISLTRVALFLPNKRYSYSSDSKQQTVSAKRALECQGSRQREEVQTVKGNEAARTAQVQT